LVDLLIPILCGLLLIPIGLAIGYGAWRLVQIPAQEWRESAFDYVFIDDHGNARELSDEEDEELTTTLFPDEVARFCIKPQYESRRSDGRQDGYLRRRQLPRSISVGPPPELG
jgi:hypothetical protein